jgi:nicotinate-nucleotide pyrophosphorylase (carboxylating)
MLNPIIVKQFVRQTLLEDIGHGRDVTGELLIPGNVNARGVITSRDAGILAGLIPALTAFTLSDPDFSIDVLAQDGDLLAPGSEIAVIEGPARAMLSAERTALNIMTHLSGIASMTAVYVNEVKHTKARIAATRKTLPGLRYFQKYAVGVGGGYPHRYGLDDALLIKDNHIAVAGGIKDAISNIKDSAGHMLRIEIEVETLDQLKQVIKIGGVDNILLDNMDLKTLKKAVELIGGKYVTEASGGVTLETVANIAETGVDYISVGALTHSASSLDIGLDIEI